jgi:hypothetical protein
MAPGPFADGDQPDMAGNEIEHAGSDKGIVKHHRGAAQ